MYNVSASYLLKIDITHTLVVECWSRRILCCINLAKSMLLRHCHSSLYVYLPIVPSQPQALRVTFINATTVSVVWEPPLSPNGIILNYTIDIAPEPSGTLPMIISADTNETLGGLEPATTYTVAVRGMTSAGNGEAANFVVTTLPGEWQP